MDNKYSVYRKIRYDRTYRTLGKMSWWRIVLGIALLVLVLLLSGTVSQAFAGNGQFNTARALMISPAWMDAYKPEVKAYIEAGVLFENGDYEAAGEAFGEITGYEPAERMRSVCSAEIARERLAAGDYDGAFEALKSVNAAMLPDTEEFYRTCSELLACYSAEPETNDWEIQFLEELLNKQSGAQ